MGMPMHAPSLAETTAFVAIVELKSFTKAAKQLALSPPRVSEMVRNLEERLGVRLVERTIFSATTQSASRPRRSDSDHRAWQHGRCRATGSDKRGSESSGLP